MPEAEGRSPMARFANCVSNMIDGPITWFRESVVEPNHKHYPWYHQKFRRVPTIDQCYTDDIVCQFEADQQFRRDRMVDNEVLNILRQRFEDCILYEKPDHEVKCKDVLEQYQKAQENWFIKYGDLGAYGNARSCYMKQKHRMIWERRHGPVGSGMKTSEHDH
ncbi:NADH dehydrogenase [ubiquinone] 1 beta subcomplex subunit 10 [Condylostylus longicornis]|uniref:NADH dehydrogenase [ubiquinone] 1 beta subcomplex subunit 10 n=1 Tax=Condylostylus longicornis TaxID=2530218 RepID=UPI00244DD9C4|nr:NADH dehydrogenase [ubiquinone] 1 beta subcomplex subunit 10 [Condylostylus longicornis]